MSRRRNNTQSTENVQRTNRKWTDAEDQRLLQQIRVFPHNLNSCFTIVAEEIGRSKGAVANHWYTVLSKRDDLPPEFGLLTSRSFCKNRKNGEGIEIPISIWQRFLNSIRSIFQ